MWREELQRQQHCLSGVAYHRSGLWGVMFGKQASNHLSQTAAAVRNRLRHETDVSKNNIDLRCWSWYDTPVYLTAFLGVSYHSTTSNTGKNIVAVRGKGEREVGPPSLLPAASPSLKYIRQEKRSTRRNMAERRAYLRRVTSLLRCDFICFFYWEALL